jgi:hypothetical protein
MDVSAVSSASATAGSSADAASNKATLDYDTFLTLLVRADEEPGSDRADGFDRADRPACDLQPG